VLFSFFVLSSGCEIEESITEVHTGSCVKLFGGSKACLTEEFLNPLDCDDREPGVECTIETEHVVRHLGKCIAIGRRVKLCRAGNFISPSEECS
jgi:hypothetical protein